jgi:hypothetical protein
MTNRALASVTASKASVATEAVSRRLQVDYYEEDRKAWHCARQGGIAGAAEPPPELVFSCTAVPASCLFREDPPPPPPILSVDSFSNLEAAAAAAPARRPVIVDSGMCLSMHQPYASLLVANIKKHEGRNWPTDHRGRLWIHAAAAKPIGLSEVEAHYRQFVPESTKFPTHYPTGVLLGYVTVTDCLDKVQYRDRYPPEQRQESSEYSFICEGGRELPLLLAMEGRAKVFKLEKKIWQAAKKQLNERMDP